MELGKRLVSELKKSFPGFSPFLIAGVVVVLVPIFVVMTLGNIQEQKRRTVEKLIGKGVFLIRAFEAGARTGMMSMRFGVSRVQRLIMETALQPEVAYMMITTVDGEILAHSNPDLVGTRYDDMPDVAALNDPSRLLHREIPSQSDEIVPVFQVIKRFTPAHRRSRKGRPLPPWCMGEGAHFPECPPLFEAPGSPGEAPGSPGEAPGRPSEALGNPGEASGNPGEAPGNPGGEWENPGDEPKNPGDERAVERKMDWFRAHFFSRDRKIDGKNTAWGEGQIIVAALDMSDSQRESRQYLRHAIVMGALFFILGCAGIVIVLVIQGYRSVRSSLVLMKAEVERSRRLAAVGKLAAGVAHEIRNPLSSIKGFATWFRERYGSVAEDREVADVMIQEVERLNRAVTQLLELSKPLPVTKKSIDLEETLSHSIKLVAQELEQKRIAVDLQVDVPLRQRQIETDPDRLNQILLNLYLNAVQAMEEGDGGTLGVRASQSGTGAGRSLLLTVSDTGRGIDAADIDHIFDPYFTNRPGGTGLGLAMVHRAVEALGGEIRVESEKGKGTCFFIRLPAGRI